jgi:hypothetical protein
VGQWVTQLEVNQIEAEQTLPVTTPDPAAPGTSSASLKVMIPNRPVSHREFPHTPIHFDIGDRSGTYEASEYNAGRGGHQRSRPPKTKFPRFDGENPKWWKTVSEKYFALYAVDHDTWASFASMHFVGSAALWLQSYEAEHDVDGWEELCVAVHTKFGKNKHQRYLAALERCKQTGTVEQYYHKFEELRHKVLVHNKHYDETFFVTKFVNGLRKDI